ncbi:MAG: ankyrin repeat domain-containing protein [Bacteroidales bacterium]
MKKGLIFIWMIFAVFFTAAQGHEKVSEQELYKAVKNGDYQTVEKFVEQGNPINGIYGRKDMTLINYSIRYGQADILERLLKDGADPDKPSGGKTPLMYAVQHREPEMAGLLLRMGANPDGRARKGYTPLMFAAKTNKLEFVKLFIEHGAQAQLENDNEFTALDLANLANYPEVATYLVKVIEMRNYYKGSPGYEDGPHVEWLSNKKVRMFYMRYDTVKDFPVLTEDFFAVNDDTATITSFATGREYTLVRNIKADPSNYEDVSKILAIGDIHGHYQSLVNYLRVNNVIDDSLNWIWGNGHVVMLGDVFDRGNEVTESLWFIYQLDLKARRQGGRVHMLLGNHEVMVMVNDTRYINRKYELFSNYFMKDYSQFFDRNSALGQWLRTRNTIIRINDNLFSHAGISPALYNRRLSIPKINFLLQEYLAHDPLAPNRYPELTDLILNAYGPLWYRGYLFDDQEGYKIRKHEVEKILSFYDASKIIIAHSEVKTVSTMFDGYVIAIDVPIRMRKSVPEGLYIDQSGFYRLQHDGSMVSLF